MAELNRCYQYFGAAVLALSVQGVCTASEETAGRDGFEPGYKVNIYYQPRPPTRPASRPIMDLKRIRALKGSDCTVGGENWTPLGETALLRGTLSLPIADTQARLHAAAQLSQDPAMAIHLLADELASGDGIRTHAAALTIAFVAAKADPSLQTDRTEQALIRLEQAAKRAEQPCADCAYLRALQAWRAGNAAAARRLVESARALDPGYFNALALAVILRVEQLEGTAAARPDSCVKTLTGLMDTLMMLSELNPCPLQAGHLDLLVSRRFEHPDRHSAILATRLVLAEIARNRPAAEAALGALRSGHDLHPACKRRLVIDARRLLQSDRIPGR